MILKIFKVDKIENSHLSVTFRIKLYVNTDFLYCGRINAYSLYANFKF